MMILGGAILFPLSGQSIIKKANKQYELKAYDLAIHNYKKYLKENPSSIEATVKLAECFRHVNKPLNAVAEYRKVVGPYDVKPEYILNYAHTLKTVGKYNDAQALYETYKLDYPIVGEHFSLSCDFAKTSLFEDDKFDLKLLGTCSNASDFGVSFYEGKIVYSSFMSYENGGIQKSNKSLIAKAHNQLFITESLDPHYKDKPLVLRGLLKEKENLGPISYAPDIAKCAFTQNTFVNGHQFVTATDNDLSIYIADVVNGGDFVSPVAFKHNEPGYASAFPCLAFEGGTAMYFASNRPGGQGGYDIYVSYYNDGDWTLPENLGEDINTPGNEITPYFNGNQLMFASDFHQGLGGFDIFTSRVLQGVWTFPENAGKGVNSPSDDYFPAIAGNKDVYFSSNRLGGRGSDDIYIASPKAQELASASFVATPEEDIAFVPKAVSLKDLNPNANMGVSGNPLGVSTSVAVAEEMDVPKAVKIDDVAPNARVIEGEKKETAVLDETQITKVETKNITDIVSNANTSKVVVDENKTDEMPIAFKIPDAKPIGAVSLNLSAARRVAHGEIITNKAGVYFVQLAAIFNTNPNVEPFRKLIEYGNIYKVHKAKSTKIRLGYYADEYEARRILSQVKSKGYRDAFITKEVLNTSQLELAISNYGSVNTEPSVNKQDFNYTNNYSVNTRYKIRLASYEDPIWFDVNSVKDIGEIEQWTKGAWTIFVLGGYDDIQDAERAKIQAINRGFTDAEVVLDNNGILERIVKN